MTLPPPLKNLADLEQLELLAEGGHARIYACDYQGQAAVLRLTLEKHDFQNEIRLWHLLAPRGVPIPQTFASGQWGEYEYAVSARCPGKADKAPKQIEALLKPLVHIMQQVHSAPLPLDGKIWGEHKEHIWYQAICWQEKLSFYQASYQNWYQNNPQELQAFNSLGSFLDIWLFLMAKIPSRQFFLLHGDLKFENICIQDTHITGLIDWQLSSVGDWVFDYAYLLLRLPSPWFFEALPERQRLVQYILTRYKTAGFNTHFYHCRLLCCILFQATAAIHREIHCNNTEFALYIQKKALELFKQLNNAVKAELEA